MQTTATELYGELSPDGHWLAYQSDESGQNQIWVRPFPNVDGGHWQISTSGGITPVWARNGKELFYLDGTNAVTSVPVQTAPTFSAGTPTKLFDGRYFGAAIWSHLRRLAGWSAVSDDQGQRSRRSDVHAGEHGRRAQLARGVEGESISRKIASVLPQRTVPYEVWMAACEADRWNSPA